MSTPTERKPRKIQSVNPYNGETLDNYEDMTPEAIDAAIAKAHEAYQSWKETSFAERAKILTRASELFLERKEELALLMAQEMGKKLEHGRGEVELVAEIFDYYAKEGERILAPKP